MSAPRFYSPAPLVRESIRSEVDLPASVARHAAQVLRLRVGDRVTLFDGRGGEYAATLARIGKSGVAAQLLHYDPVEREAEHPVTLVQAVIAAEMMDLVVRKAVELGAAAIVPVVAERSQRIPDDRIDKRVAHWRQIAIAACEQCGRNRIPPVADVESLSGYLDGGALADAAVILAPDAATTLVSAARARIPTAVLIGPEGGFTPAELDHAERRGVRRARLGQRVLRSETAALAALAAIETIATS